MKGIPFPRKRLEEARERLKVSQAENLERIIDIRFLDSKTKDKLKG